jgi:ketosteroid isomerase-like protein
MTDPSKDSPETLQEAIDRYNAAWNAHDLDAIMAMHAPDMVFENHTAGESAEGEAARAHIGSIFTTWPDIAFATRRLYVREGLVVQEWTATATHTASSSARTSTPTASRSCARWACWIRRVAFLSLFERKATPHQRFQLGS